MKEIKTAAIIGLGNLGIAYGNHLSKKIPKEDNRLTYDHMGMLCFGDGGKGYYDRSNARSHSAFGTGWNSADGTGWNSADGRII
ncbi:MAG TPA: hypothetical protein VM577_02520 [Anaerovoracaceae bacterium]|nr:hypothetical protein [Anaerovoracaceae bacterium]